MDTNKGNVGKLYICPTPIGNLEDITIRVLNVLKEVDVIACEDTRQTAKLTSRYEIHTTLTSYHEHNRRTKGEKLLELLLNGKDVALVSDAGMPGISDPGEDLVALCIENGIEYTVLPGPSAGITALVMSGIDNTRFVFEGFLSKETAKRRKILEDITREERTIILYESPHHLEKTLKDLKDYLGQRRMTIVREISKKFEEKIYTSTDKALSLFENKQIKGEFVIIIEGLSKEDIQRENAKIYEDLTLTEHLNLYMEKGFDKKEAMKKVAMDLGISKRDVYQRLLKEEE